MWEIFALSAALAWSIVTVLDKVLLERHIPSGNVYLILHGFVGMIPVLGMALLGRPFEFADLSMLGLALLAGVLESIFMLLYYKALQITDASIVAIFLQGVPVITTFISFFFFHENFFLTTYLGIAMIVLGTILVILIGSPGQHRIEWKAMVLILPALFAISVSYSLQSYTLRFINVDTFFGTARVGQLLVGLVLLSLPIIRKEWVGIVSQLRPTIWLITIAIGLLNIFGTYLLNQAYALGPLALVTTLSSIQPILILVLISLANSIRPHLVPDEGSQKFFWRRSAATLLVIVGILVSST
ncbi:MAG: EamA family transporter [Chloroflexi bacterium]|nr:EamA family transporter [Chloroflexota bacterium]